MLLLIIDDLCEASKVCRLWYNLASDSYLWKKFCFSPRWRFSDISEKKQILKYTSESNYIDVIYLFFSF